MMFENCCEIAGGGTWVDEWMRFEEFFLCLVVESGGDYMSVFYIRRFIFV